LLSITEPESEISYAYKKTCIAILNTISHNIFFDKLILAPFKADSD